MYGENSGYGAVLGGQPMEAMVRNAPRPAGRLDGIAHSQDEILMRIAKLTETVRMNADRLLGSMPPAKETAVQAGRLEPGHSGIALRRVEQGVGSISMALNELGVQISRFEEM